MRALFFDTPQWRQPIPAAASKRPASYNPSKASLSLLSDTGDRQAQLHEISAVDRDDVRLVRALARKALGGEHRVGLQLEGTTAAVALLLPV